MTMRRSKRRSHSAYGQESCDVCIRELRQTLKKLQSVADITCAFAVEMARLRKLREAVQKAEEATASTAKQRHYEKHSLASQRLDQVFPDPVARAFDVISLVHLHEALIRDDKETRAFPGRLFFNPGGAR